MSHSFLDALFRRHSLQTRVTVVSLVIFLISVWCLSFMGGYLLRQDLQRVMGGQLHSTANFIANHINDDLNDRFAALQQVAAGLSESDLRNADVLQRFLERQQGLPLLFNAGFWITGTDGVATASVPRDLGRLGLNFSDRDYVREVLAKAAPTVGKPTIGAALQKPVFAMAVPIMGRQGQVAGILIGGTNLGQPNFLDQINEARYGATGGYLLIAPKHGIFVTGSDRSRALQPLPAPGLNAMHDRYMAGFDGYGLAVNSRGVEELSAASHIPAAGWFVATVLPSSEAFAPIAQTQQQIFFAALALTLLAGLLTWWLVARLVRNQLAQVLETSRALARQSDSNESKIDLPVAKDDEIGEMVRGFNSLLDRSVQRETLLKQILDTSSVAIFLIDAHGRISMANQSMAEMFRCPVEQLVGSEYLALVHPDHQEVARARYLPALRGQEFATVDDDRHYLRTDGSDFWGRLTGSRFVSSTGATSGLIGVIADITERWRAKEALRESQQHLESLLESLPVGMVVHQDGKIQYANATAAHIVGATTSTALVGLPVMELVHPDSRQVVRDRIRAALERGVSGQHLGNQEEVFFRLDGSMVHVETRSKLIPYRGGTAVQVAVVDISHRKTLESATAFLAQSSVGAGLGGFFQSLARYLAEALHVDYICIDRLVEEDHAQTLAVWCDGRFEDNARYALRGTPCGEVVGRDVCVFESGVREQFPNDAALQSLGAEGYIGVTLWNSAGKPIGLIAAISRTPLVDAALSRAIIKLAAVRSAGELESAIATEALRESEALWALVLDSTGDGVWDWYVQTGEKYYSRRFREMYGYDGLDLADGPKDFYELTDPADRPHQSKARDAHFKGETAYYASEHRMRCKDGSWKWVLSRGMVISRDAEGRPVRMVGTHTDITERKQAELLQQALFHISEAFQSEEDFLSVLGKLHHIVRGLISANNFYVALVNEKRDELSFPYFVDEFDPPPLPRPLSEGGLTERVLFAGQAILMTPELLDQEGAGQSGFMGTRCIDWLGVPLKVGDSVVGVLAVQNYSGSTRYRETDQDVLQFVANHVAVLLERRQAKAKEQYLQTMMARTERVGHIGSWEWDVGTNVVTWSAEMYRLFERDPALGVPEFAVLRQFYSANDMVRLQAAIDRSLKDGLPFDRELCATLPGGKVRYWQMLGYPERDAAGKVVRLAGSMQDVTERKEEQRKLRLAASVFTHAREGIMITDADGTILDVNDAFSRITGYSREDALGNNPRMLRSGRHLAKDYEAMWKSLAEEGHWYGEIWNRRKNGEVFAEMQTISAVRSAEGVTQHYVSLFTDITVMKEQQRRLEHIAHFDALTSLPNRVLLADRLQQAMVQSQRRGRSLAVVYLDLDGFKQVNDRYGHGVGDTLLVTVSQHIKEALREGDTLARIGGDEFVAVLVDLDTAQDCEPILTRLLQAAAERVIIGDATLQVSASIGVTMYPKDGADADLLLRHADQAMYVAKDAGKNRHHFFDVDSAVAVQTRRESLHGLADAMAQRQFVLHYQPKVNMRDGKVVGAEALIRWQHPQRGLLPPAAFLGLVDNHPMAIAIGEWVIDTALAQMSAWRNEGLDLPVSVNIGALQLQQADFAVCLGGLLGRFPEVSPDRLQLEVLESNALDDIERVGSVMRECQAMGVSFALDDFGTGYASLTYLRRLPAHTLKIDQSFVRDMLTNPDDRAIVQGVIGLAQTFGRSVIAEGVETAELGQRLLALGCDLAQGYGISRPMPADDLVRWVRQWETHREWTA